MFLAAVRGKSIDYHHYSLMYHHIFQIKPRFFIILTFTLLLLDEVWQVLEATGFTDKYDSQIYLSVHDAVLAATVEGEGEYGNEASILT